jgi:hypothetical protein
MKLEKLKLGLSGNFKQPFVLFFGCTNCKTVEANLLTFCGVTQRLVLYCSRLGVCNKASRVFEAKMHSTVRRLNGYGNQMVKVKAKFTPAQAA